MIKKNLNFDISNKNSIDYHIIIDKLGDIPNKIYLYGEYEKDLFIDGVDLKNVNRTSEISMDGEVINEVILSNITDTNIYITYINIDNSIISDITFYYLGDRDYNFILKLVKDLNIGDQLEDENDVSNKDNLLSYLSLSESGFILNSLDIKSDIPTNLKYNKETLREYKKKLKYLVGESGIEIFYGSRGTGKTNLAFQMFKDLGRSAIFIPNNLIEVSLGNPEFINFIKNIHNPALIIDDCEFLTNSQFSKMNLFSSNLLQLVESPILGNLNLLIVLIFNEDLDHIDDNLLSSNSLINILEFDKLNIKEVIKLKEYLNISVEESNKSKLSHILNPKKIKQTGKIGL
jgi:hypothetical protein